MSLNAWEAEAEGLCFPNQPEEVCHNLTVPQNQLLDPAAQCLSVTVSSLPLCSLFLLDTLGHPLGQGLNMKCPSWALWFPEDNPIFGVVETSGGRASKGRAPQWAGLWKLFPCLFPSFSISAP